MASKKVREHVLPVAVVGSVLGFISLVAAVILRFLLTSSNLHSRLVMEVSSCLGLYGVSLVFFWGLFLAAITELQGAKNFFRTLLTGIGLLQLAFIAIYFTLLLSGRPLVLSESPNANYIFTHFLILQMIPLCALFFGVNNNDQFFMNFFLLSQTVVFVGVFLSFSYILVIILGPALMSHVKLLQLVSLVVGGSFGLLLCIASTYMDILGEIEANTRARDPEIQI